MPTGGEQHQAGDGEAHADTCREAVAYHTEHDVETINSATSSVRVPASSLRTRFCAVSLVIFFQKFRPVISMLEPTRVSESSDTGFHRKPAAAQNGLSYVVADVNTRRDLRLSHSCGF
jgi:hypothetical protein